VADQLDQSVLRMGQLEETVLALQDELASAREERASLEVRRRAASRLSLYTILFRFKALLWESIRLLLPSLL